MRILRTRRGTSGIPKRELPLKPFRMIETRKIMHGQYLPAYRDRTGIPLAPEQPALQLGRKVKLLTEVPLYPLHSREGFTESSSGACDAKG